MNVQPLTSRPIRTADTFRFESNKNRCRRVSKRPGQNHAWPTHRNLFDSEALRGICRMSMKLIRLCTTFRTTRLGLRFFMRLQNWLGRAWPGPSRYWWTLLAQHFLIFSAFFLSVHVFHCIVSFVLITRDALLWSTKVCKEDSPSTRFFSYISRYTLAFNHYVYEGEIHEKD